MSNIGSYTSRSFSESQKFLVLDPSTGTTSLVLGADLVSYITPRINSVIAETTRLAAENTDYDVGTIIQTSGAESVGDNFAATYLVVGAGEGDFPMINGNELLIIKGDEFLREQLISEAAGEGASLVSMEGGPTVETAINNRVIRVGSVAEIADYDVPAGYVFSVNDGGTSGDFDVISGDFSTDLAADTKNGVYAAVGGDASASTKVAKRRFVDTLSIDFFGAVGDGITDDTDSIDAAIDVFNSSTASTLIATANKQYLYNGDGKGPASNKTFDMMYAEFITDSSTLLFFTDGAYDDHVENVLIRRVRTEGFADPIQLLFADNSTVEFCACLNPSNIGIQTKGDDLYGNVIQYNFVDSPGFHCYANNDSVNFDPSHSDQGQRYPKDTLFFHNAAFNAGALAYNVHSSSDGGLSRVVGGYVYNCDQLYKNSYGNCIFEDVFIEKNGAGSGSTWLAQVGARNGYDDNFHHFKNNTFWIDEKELICIVYGNCEIEENTINYTGTSAVNTQFVFVSDDAKTVRVSENEFFGGPLEYGAGTFIFTRDGISVGEFSVLGNTINNEINLTTASDNIIFIDDSDFEEIKIEDNTVTMASGSAVGDFVLATPVTTESFVCKNNRIKGIDFLDLRLLTGLVEKASIVDNFGVRVEERYADVVRLLTVKTLDGRYPREVPGDSSGTATTLVRDFVAGEEFLVTISADRSNNSGSFDTLVQYGVMVSRDGSTVSSGFNTFVGSESDIGAVFQISGTDLQYYTGFTTLVYVRVDRIGQRS